MRVLANLLMVGALFALLTGCAGEAKGPNGGKFNNVADNLATEGMSEGTGAEVMKAAPATESSARDKASDKPAGGLVSGVTPNGTIGKVEGKTGADKKAAGSFTPTPEPASPTPLAAIADPVVGTAKAAKTKQEAELPAGILTAGSFDDNLDPKVFATFLKRMSQQRGLQDIPVKMQGQRLFIRVKDAAGKPVGGAKVQLIAATGQAAELVTRTDGRAIFLTSFDGLPSDVALTASVTPPEGGAPVTERIDAGAPRWEITLPAADGRLPKNLDLAIVLDTTGSMGDELDFLKAEIRNISKAVHDRFPEVQQRFALVVYRDDGDEYVARHFDFASLDVFHTKLSEQRAAGGGDYPEAVHRGLEAANQLRWRSQDTARLLFWVADAPPHAQHMNRTMTAAAALRKQGIAIYPVACSGYDDPCEVVMRSCALLTGGQFLFLTDDSGVGGSHAEPKIPYYQVQSLEKMMARMIASELSGQRIEPGPADIIRTVGRKVN